MVKSKTQKTVVAGLMLALGILLPLVTSHSIALLPGNVLLPMHIPVLLCGFFCGPMYGAISGLILPFLNSTLTSMPVLYPTAIVMSGELFTYGLMTGLIHKFTGYSQKLRHIYPALILSMVSGRVTYGILSGILLFFNPAMKRLSVITALIQGVPGIIIQLILIPVIVSGIYKNFTRHRSLEANAIKMVEKGFKSCVVIKDNKITYAESRKGIAHILTLYDSGMLKDAYIADTIVGKAAAMIFTRAGISGCYGKTISKKALIQLNKYNIKTTYNTLAENIINRKGDGLCPMESAVIDIDDEVQAIKILRETIEKLQNDSTNQDKTKQS